ncbi:hypothetical protein HWV62_34561 [Athelia sp. TMB]|nr:hypothetical protein HWV62_34561 [Athelia sp. TMB]
MSDMSYFTNITLGGQSYAVLIDTGSLIADVLLLGPVLLADLGFEGYSVKNQAFFFAEANATNELPAPGIIGLGPFSTSAIVVALTTKTTTVQGLPPLDNIFQQSPNTPNFLTVLLGRASDPDHNYPGDLTIMEILPGYEAVLEQPKLPVALAQHGNQHWSTLLDADGFIGPDGEPIPVKTGVKSTKNKKQLTVMFDTGYMAEAIYGRFTGSKLEKNSVLGEIWTLPCDAEVNITLKFSGQSIPIHPLDATFPFSRIGSSRTDCYGTFQAITTGANPDLDVIMGMAFLRNAYFLVNFGSDFSAVLPDHLRPVLNGTDNSEPPYIQLLPTSNDAAEVHDDFVQVRLEGKTFSELSALKAKAKSAGKTIAKGIIIAIVVVGVVFLGLIALCGYFCFRRRSGKLQSYRDLNAPAPAAAIDMHMYAPSPGPPVSGPYVTAWDHRP